MGPVAREGRVPGPGRSLGDEIQTLSLLLCERHQDSREKRLGAVTWLGSRHRGEGRKVGVVGRLLSVTAGLTAPL